MQWLKHFLCWGAMLASHVCGYNVQDLHTLNLQIVKSTGELLSFDLALNADNQFSATIQNLDAGLTNITLNGYDKDGTKMYNGDWEGDVRQDGKPTQVELFMVDLKPDIDVATLDNIAPFFISIEMEPSNIAKNETVQVKTRAKDLDDGASALNYTFRPLSPLYGDITNCPNASEYCTTSYLSDMQDTNGIKEFEMDVSDGRANDTVKGGFNIRAYGGVDLVINFNNRPGVSAISTNNSFLYDQDGHRSLEVNLTMFDDNYVEWTWDVEGLDPACDVMALTGDVQGTYALQKEISIVYEPFQFLESECKLKLELEDVSDTDLTYKMEIPFYVGNKLYNTAPYVSTGYSTASSAPAGTTITYVVHARDKGLSEQLQATWNVTGAGTILESSSANTTSITTPNGFVQYTFIMKLNSTGDAGSVLCTVEDAYQLQAQLDFTVGRYVTFTTTSTAAPTTSTTPSSPFGRRRRGGGMSTTTTTTTTSSSPSGLAACVSQIGFVNDRNTLQQISSGGCSSAQGFYSTGCTIYQQGVALGDACDALARTSSSCTLQGCDGQNPPECDQALLSAQGPRSTTRSWTAASYTECASACSATVNSYWHGIYIKQCQTGCAVQACTPARRLLQSEVTPYGAIPDRRRLAQAASPVINPYVFGLSMSIQDRTLQIQSNTVPVPDAPSTPPGVDRVNAKSSETSGSSDSSLVLGLAIGGGFLALIVGSAFYQRKESTAASTPAPEQPVSPASQT